MSLLELIILAIFILYVVGLWMVFVKAGEAGWKAIIPIWNTLIMLKLVGRDWWWILLMLIPFVGFVIWVIVSLDLAKSFGRGTGFGLGLAFIPIVWYPLLGFGPEKYNGPSVKTA